MEHIVNLSFAIDDGDIIERVIDSCVKESVRKVESIVKDTIDGGRYSSKERVIEITREEVAKVIERREDEIVDKAIEKIYQSVVRRASFKEKLAEV